MWGITCNGSDQDVEELATLVVQAQEGDLDAYGVIVQRCQGMALATAYARLRDRHLAEDAVQEAFVQAFRDLTDLRKPEAFPGWLKRIVFKYCDRATRGKRLPTIGLECAAEVRSSAPGPDDELHLKELRRRVRDAVQALPDSQRTTTQLFYVDGYSQKEVAEFMEVPLTTVKKRLHDARKRLRISMLYIEED
jgi:RNA polymerase sigma factor (sigma-70 family)